MWFLLLAALVAAILQFIWGAIFWANIAFKLNLYQQTGDDAKVAAVLDENILTSGNYFLPHPSGMNSSDAAVKEAFLKRSVSGPLVHIAYHRGGQNSGLTFGIGFLHFFLASLLVAALLSFAAPGLPTYSAKLLFVTMIGVFAAFTVTLADPIWFHHPLKFAFGKVVFEVVCWFLAGLVLGAMVG